MSISSLKNHFCETLKKYIKASKVRQVDLARVLELSPSAVSQMLSGRINPNLKQLDAMTQLLSLDRKECADLRDCLLRIRSGDEELRSPLNDFIKSSRTRHGLTVEQLAYMTGIPVDIICMLENKLNVQPTPHEAVKLAAVFGCSQDELWQVAPERNSFSVPEVTVNNQNLVPGMVLMSEAGSQYQADGSSATKTPVIKFDNLRHFDPRYDQLMEFAWRHMCRHLDEHKAGVVVVEASGRDFGWDDLYNVQLEIAELKQWVAGMTVIGIVDDELVLGKALEKSMQIIPMGDCEVLKCQHCWVVASLSFCSDFFLAMDKKSRSMTFRRTAAVLKTQQNIDSEKKSGEDK